MRLDVESLRTFLAVVNAGGITRAAAHLNLSQSAVSWKLKRLEHRVGRPLTRLNARRTTLTEEGQMLFLHATRIVDAHDEAVIQMSADDVSGKVRIGITEDMAVDGVANAIGRFSRRYPQITVSIKMEQSLNLARWLASGDVDIAFIQLSADDVWASDIVLGRDKLVWVAADKAIAELDPLPLVTFGPDCFYRSLMSESLKKAGKKGRIVVQAPSTSAVMAALSAGLGIGILRKGQIVGMSNLEPLNNFAASLPMTAQVLRVSRSLPRRIAEPLQSAMTERTVLFDSTWGSGKAHRGKRK